MEALKKCMSMLCPKEWGRNPYIAAALNELYFLWIAPFLSAEDNDTLLIDQIFLIRETGPVELNVELQVRVCV